MSAFWKVVMVATLVTSFGQLPFTWANRHLLGNEGLVLTSFQLTLESIGNLNRRLDALEAKLD